MSSVHNPDATFRIEVIQLDHSVVVALIGELDAASTPEFGECLVTLARMGATHVELDVSELSYLDSAGMAIFRQHRNAFAALGGSLSIQDPTTRAFRLLDTTGTGRVHNTTTDQRSIGGDI